MCISKENNTIFPVLEEDLEFQNLLNDELEDEIANQDDLDIFSLFERTLAELIQLITLIPNEDIECNEMYLEFQSIMDWNLFIFA